MGTYRIIQLSSFRKKCPVVKRQIDIYDGAQTVVLMILFYRAAGYFEHDLGRPAPRPSAPPYRPPITNRPTLHIGQARDAQHPLYLNLLNKAMGDGDKVERLIAYERMAAPHASRTELMERAIIRWERDNR
jgi:hypothetical protein